jgi:hypothetical protein
LQKLKYGLRADMDAKSDADNKSGQAANSRPKRKRGSFATINNVLSRLVTKLGLDRRLKEHALMGLWPVVAGDFFAKQSRPLFIDTENSLVVTVKDASVAQELSLKKREILRKLQQAATSLGMTVSGLRFDLKHYHGTRTDMALEASLRVKPLPDPTDLELAAIDLSTEELGQLAIVAQELRETEQNTGGGLSQEINLASRMAAICEREIRLRKWRIARGYPQCSLCQEAVTLLHGSGGHCMECFYRSQKPYLT